MQQHVHPGQGVLRPEPLPDQVSDPRQRPALILIAAGSRAGIQDRFQLGQPGRGELALRPARAPRGQRLPPARGQRPPPPVRRHPADPEPPRHLRVAGTALDHVSRFQPHFLPAGPLLRGQPAAIGVPHDTGIPRTAGQHQTP